MLLYLLVFVILLVISGKIYFTISVSNFESSFPTKSAQPQVKIEEKSVELNGTKMKYYVSGKPNGELILFIHPAFSDHRAFNLQLEFFDKNYRVITVDLLGHGFSKTINDSDKIDQSAALIHQILLNENQKEAHVVGVSIGSLIAQYYAYQFPEELASLTALGGYNIHEINPEIEKIQSEFKMGFIMRILLSLKAFRKNVALQTVSSENAQALFYHSTSEFERKSLPLMDGLKNIIVDRKEVEFSYPMLILTGDGDIEIAKKAALEWHHKLPKSEYYIIKNAGHCANLDQPEKFNQLLLNFIEKVIPN